LAGGPLEQVQPGASAEAFMRRIGHHEAHPRYRRVSLGARG
jgi:hypothetical protein